MYNKSAVEYLLEKSVRNNETQGTSNVWMFRCRAGLTQSTCGMYEIDPDSRGAKSGFAGCASCVRRSAANTATFMEEIS